jgi:hypothetical protein
MARIAIGRKTLIDCKYDEVFTIEYRRLYELEFSRAFGELYSHAPREGR